MRRALRLLVFLILVLSAFSVPMSVLAASAQQNVAEPYIVTFSPTTPGAGIVAAALAQRNGFKVDRTFDTVIKGFSARLTSSQVSILRATSSVTSIQADLPTHITAQTVPTGIKRIGDLANSTASIDGIDNPLNIDIATLDTGIDPTHPDLNVVGGYNCSSSNTSAWADNNGHGTHVAGTIAAIDNGSGVVGVAPGARLWSVKVFDSNGSGYVSWIICGINWIAQHSNTIKVVNFSGSWTGVNSANCGVNNTWWGQYVSDSAHQAVCNLVNTYGVPFVVAAGNSGIDASSTLPAAYPETIAVGAIADSDGLPGGLGPSTSYGADDTRASFSNYGPAVTLYAPGVNIYSTWMGGGYATASGTSMASPHVTGAVALYLLNHPGATPSQVKQALVANGEPGNWGAPYGSQPLLNVNNTAFGGGVVAPVHDVEVTSISTLTPASQGVPTTVRVHIANQGNQAESNLTVALTDGGNSVGNQTGLSLALSAGQDVDIPWTPSTSGNHTLLATVSNTNTNHNKSVVVSVATVTHDVEVTSIAPLSTAFDGIANTIRVHVVNQGNQAESGLSVSLTDNNVAVGSTQSVSGSLSPGSGADIDFSWTPSGVSTHVLKARVWNGLTDHNSTANIVVTAVIHDLEATSIAALTTPFTGIANTIRVHVVNQGNQAESGWTIGLTDNAVAVGSSKSVPGTLNPSGSVDIDFSWTPSGSGNHAMQATVSKSSTNNSYSTNINVTATVHDVEVMSIVPLSAAVDGTANTVRVHIANQGNQPESNLSVVLTDGGNTVGSQTGLSLSVGAGQDVDIPWTPSGTGNHTLTATVSNGNTTHNNSTTVNVVTQSNPQNIWEQNITANGIGNKQIAVEVSVAGGTGPIAGANVTIHVSGGNWYTGTFAQDFQVTTGSNGTGSINITVPFSSSYIVTVTNIVHAPDTYVPSQNKVWGAYTYAS